MTTDPIRTAILSYGMSGKVFHAPLLKAHPGFIIKKIVQRHGREAAEKYPDIEIEGTVERVFADPAVEVVIVNTTNETHFEFSKRAMESGKHVIVEKPFTNTVTEGEKLIEIAVSNKRMISVFQNRRWDSDFLTVKKIIDDGLIGRIAEFETSFDRFRNYIQPNTWKEHTGPGSGLLYNLGPHMIDQAIVLFGKPEAVYADIRKIRDHSMVDDYFEVQLMYPAIKVRLHSSYLVRSSNPRFVLHGTLGSFVKYGLDPQEEDLKKGRIPGSPGWGEEDPSIYGVLETEIDGKYVKKTVTSFPGNYPGFYDGIYKTLREGKPLPVTPQDSLLNIHAIELAYRSNAEKKVLEF
jgi:scyllo-inositol 2-dehydrogenase (NADP+)